MAAGGYTLELTQEDMDTCYFVGCRYFWSEAVTDNLVVGTNTIPEHVAWELRDLFEKDTEGDHSFFPMLSPHSELSEKLYAFIDGII